MPDGALRYNLSLGPLFSSASNIVRTMATVVPRRHQVSNSTYCKGIVLNCGVVRAHLDII